VFYDDITIGKLQEAINELHTRQNYQKNMSLCYDFSAAIINISMKEIEQHAERVMRFIDKGGDDHKLALVSNESLACALLNYYRLLTSKSSVDVEVFSTCRQANIWLASKY